MKVALLVVFMMQVEAAFNIANGAHCLNAIGTKTEPYSLVDMQPCNKSNPAMVWTYDEVGTGNICSVAIGACLGTVSTDLVGLSPAGKIPAIAWDYNPSTYVLSIKENCAMHLNYCTDKYNDLLKISHVKSCNDPWPDSCGNFTFVTV